MKEVDFCQTCGGSGMGCPDCEHGLVEREPAFYLSENGTWVLSADAPGQYATMVIPGAGTWEGQS